MDNFANLIDGFGHVLTPMNLLFALIGVTIGTAVGVLPGIGPAMTVALLPSVVTSQSEHFVDVETDSVLTRGMTVVDRLDVADNERNREVWAAHLTSGRKAKVFWTIDNADWKRALYAALK